MSDGSDIESVLAAGGAALTSAQQALVPGGGFRMAISDVELEIKAAVDRNGAGKLVVTPIGVHQLSQQIAPDLVSTVKVRFTAIGAEAAAEPMRPREDVVEEVRGREDVRRLDEILGGIRVHATFVPESRTWLATAADSEGRVLRRIVLDDRPS